MFYLTTHSTHFIYGYMASDIWLRTILIVRKETRCRHIGYSYRLTARVILYAPSHRQDNTYHGLCYTSRGALTGTRNSSMGPPPKTLYAKIKSIDNKMQLINASKSYKKCIYKAFSQYKFKTENTMQQLRSDNPKDFYKILKNNGLRNSNINIPPIEDFQNFFNKGDPNNDDTFDLNMDEVLNALNDNNIINDKFT